MRRRLNFGRKINDVTSHSREKTHGNAVKTTTAITHMARPNGFVELEELVHLTRDKAQWEKTARWVKLEETFESDRWSKPHVSCLSLQGLQDVRDILKKCPILTNLAERDMSGIVNAMIDELVCCGDLDEEHRDHLMDLLLLNHRLKNRTSSQSRRLARHFAVHALEEEDKELTLLRKDSGQKSRCPWSGFQVCHNNCFNSSKDNNTAHDAYGPGKGSKSSPQFKNPEKSESTVVLVGSANFLRQPISVFARLEESCFLGNLIDVNIPVRFIFIFMGPQDCRKSYCNIGRNSYHEIGRALAAMMSNKDFLSVAYDFEERETLLKTMDDFFDCCVVIPPGEWGRQVLMQTIPILERQSQKLFENRRRKHSLATQVGMHQLQDAKGDPLARTGVLFGGLVRDVKRRLPHYLSDFTDAFNVQCLAAIVFVYIASLAPAITFGGIISKKTGGKIDASETILATGLFGIIFALLGGQPLTIISFTGPLIVFEKSIYELSKNLNVDYLPLRAWIGIWVMFICFLIVAFEGCFLVRYFTRFTEEIFATIIAYTFMYDAIEIVIDEYKHPLSANGTIANATKTSTTKTSSPSSSGHLAVLLVLGTFIISYMFRRFRHSHFFGHLIRRIISDFGVLIAILSMVAYYNLDKETTVSQLVIPEGVGTKWKDRWFVNPMGENMDALTITVAIIPAILVSILIFMEVELTALILDKKEFKLKKGAGYNLDLIVVSIIVCLCSFLGFPWLCASPIHTMSHLHALMVFNSNQAPGERPVLEEVKEQRVTNVVIHILVLFSAFLAPALREIPIAVLAGVLLYLGICSVSHIQLLERIKMLFMPGHYHPDVSYVLKVSTKKMHIFTIIQVVCVSIIIVVKLTIIAPSFPFFVLCLIPLRKSLAAWFTEGELELLDNDAEEMNEDEYDEFEAVHVPI